MGIFKSVDKGIDGAIKRNDNFTAVEVAKLNNEALLVKAGMSAKEARFKLQSLEITSTNWFVAGWRPFIGWTCGLYIIGFLVMVGFGLVDAPILDRMNDFMYPIMAGALGIGAMRTREKEKNVARD